MPGIHARQRLYPPSKLLPEENDIHMKSTYPHHNQNSTWIPFKNISYETEKECQICLPYEVTSQHKDKIKVKSHHRNLVSELELHPSWPKHVYKFYPSQKLVAMITFSQALEDGEDHRSIHFQLHSCHIGTNVTQADSWACWLASLVKRVVLW